MHDDRCRVALDDTDLEEHRGPARSDDQREPFVELENPDGVAVGMQHALVAHGVLACRRSNDRIVPPVSKLTCCAVTVNCWPVASTALPVAGAQAGSSAA